jgi:polysaccharide pyruvyl transferase WcaK-like protein
MGIGHRERLRMLRGELGQVHAALQVGGDNYSLDYGRPDKFFEMDDYFLESGVPAVVLWGASVGPFESDAEYVDSARRHIKKLSAVFVRETRSLEYLQRCGINAQVRLVADPAFAMAPEEPPGALMHGLAVDQRPIGINLSRLIARYITGGDADSWAEICSRAVIRILRRSGRPILFVPHVFRWAGDDDGVFLEDVARRVKHATGQQIPVIDRRLSAAQIKWVISQCSVFVGARTHSTIAAFSTGVPTLSIAYSVKALGLNEDLFGDFKYCLAPEHLSAEAIAEATFQLIKDEDRIRQHLLFRQPEMMRRAFIAGEYLAEILHSHGKGAA